MKNKNIFIIIGAVILALCLAGGAFLLFREKPKTIISTKTDNYTAYVKINPSVKLAYEQV